MSAHLFNFPSTLPLLPALSLQTPSPATSENSLHGPISPLDSASCLSDDYDMTGFSMTQWDTMDRQVTLDIFPFTLLIVFYHTDNSSEYYKYHTKCFAQ